jgi:hypothetical protein
VCAAARKAAHEAAFCCVFTGSLSQTHLHVSFLCWAVSSCGHVNGTAASRFPQFGKNRQSIRPLPNTSSHAMGWAIVSFSTPRVSGTFADLSRSMWRARERIGLRELVIVAQFCDPEETT